LPLPFGTARAACEANGGFLLGSKAQVNSGPIMALLKHYTANDRLHHIPADVSQQLTASLEYGSEAKIDMLLPNATHVPATDQIDDLRIEFNTSDIVHLRPSGNAPALCCYTESCSKIKARELSKNHLINIQFWFLETKSQTAFRS